MLIGRLRRQNNKSAIRNPVVSKLKSRVAHQDKTRQDNPFRAPSMLLLDSDLIG